MSLSPHYREQRGYIGEITLPQVIGEYGKELMIWKAAVFLRSESSIRLTVLEADVLDFEGEVLYLPFPLFTPRFSIDRDLVIGNQQQVIEAIQTLIAGGGDSHG